jgi:uncharacterized protein YutD
MITINNQDYELIKNYRDAFDRQEVAEKLTDYYTDYDYIVGDIAYNKLRLKGFYKENNQKVKDLNNYKNLNNYLTKYCATDCRHFILEKINN